MNKIIIRNIPSLVVPLLLLSLAGCALIPDLPPAPTPTPPIPPSGYEPQPGDDQLQRDQVFLDLASSKLVLSDSLPPQVALDLNGNLSDPCHQLRVVITFDDANNKINLDVYSLFQPGKACITVIKPFSASIPLGTYSPGHYTVYVNGDLVGEFDS